MKEYRYLGAHISVNRKGHDHTFRIRVPRALATLRRIARLPIPRDQKARVIRVEVIPGVLYGVETVEGADRHMARASAAIMRTMAKDGGNHDVDLFFSSIRGTLTSTRLSRLRLGGS